MGSRLEKNSNHVRKRIENHAFDNEEGEEYQASKFGGFGDYMRRKKIKLQNLDAELRSQSEDKPKIFRGIVAHVNGYTQPSLSDLHTLIVSHGGGFLQYLDGKTAVTHVIASHLTPKKKVEFSKYRIVKPAWIVDSVKAGRCLPWHEYRVVDEGITQNVLGFDKGQITSQASTQKLGYRDQTDTSWYTSFVKDVANKIEGSTEKEVEQQMDAAIENDGSRSPQMQSDIEYYPELEPDSLVEAFPLDTVAEGGILLPDKNDANLTHVSAKSPFNAGSRSSKEPQAQALSHEKQAAKPEKRQLTAEEHNAILLQNPRLAKSSTANPDFINQYYRESRLHHLSAWKAELKAQMQARAVEKSSQKKFKRLPGARRYVMHVDFDSFFAAVSLRNKPQLKDVPVVVAHGSGPGSEIASCNYPARKFGVKNGMWMKQALNLCSNITVLPYDYKAYEEASKHFYDSILAMDGVVQSISIDEALIDVTEQCLQAGGSNGKGITDGSPYREQLKADELAELLRKAIREKTSCEVSVGIGSNILQAKCALKKAKPAGQYQLRPEDVLEYLGSLTVTDLPGVAYSIGNKLEEISVKFVKDIRELTKEKLISTLGPKTGEKIWDYSRGIDKAEVGDEVVRKSVSAEVNWGIRFINQQQAEEFVFCLCEELSKRLLENTVKGRQLTMKIMRRAADAGMDPPKNLGHGKCDTFNKSVVLGVATYDKLVIGKEAVSILRGYGFPPGELRGLGVQMQKLEPIKPAGSAAPLLIESSQRRLQFKKPEVSTSSLKPQAQPVKLSAYSDKSTEILWESPQKNTSHTNISHSETIEDIPTPKKSETQTMIGAIDSQQLNDGTLNISGTQFIIPTQIDASVLAELPADIRSKLAPKQKKLFNNISGPQTSLDENRSRSGSPYVSDHDGMPNESQLDPESLAALPEDLRQEVLAQYRVGNRSGSSAKLQQSIPQSPHKTKSVKPKRTTVTPTKKQRTSTLLGKSRSKHGHTSGSTLTQSNFISMTKPSETSIVEEEISQSFLDELPEDIRAEILAEQRRNRMKQKSGLNVGTMKRKPKVFESNDAARGQQKLQLPSQSSRPTFTSRKLTELADLREAMSAWVQEFSGDGEEGPFEEDAQALGIYLSRVVMEELDLAKAVAVVDWLVYVVEDWPFDKLDIQQSWNDTILSLKDKVQEAIAERGLAPVQFAA